MLRRPPPDDDADRKRAHERELARERQRRHRKLADNGLERVTIRYSETVTAALYWQAIDAKMSEAEAIAASTDKAKIAEGLASNHEAWAQRYIRQRDRP